MPRRWITVSCLFITFSLSVSSIVCWMNASLVVTALWISDSLIISASSALALHALDSASALFDSSSATAKSLLRSWYFLFKFSVSAARLAAIFCLASISPSKLSYSS